MSVNRAGLSALLHACVLVCAGCPSDDDDGTRDAVDAMVPDEASTDADVADSGPPALTCPGGCAIDNACIPNGVVNPGNPCQLCTSALASMAWSANDGVRCDDGAFCTTDDLCNGGSCGGAARSCDDHVACNGAELCDDQRDLCLVSAGMCESGQLCDAVSGGCVQLDVCPGCLIDDICYGDGQRNPANSCLACVAQSSNTAWSNVEGAACDDGLFCTVGETCMGGACLGLGARRCNDGVACNGLETCDEAADRCTQALVTCSGGQLCDVAGDRCITRCDGCVVGGVCYANGTRSPLNQCQLCDVARSRSAFVPNDGASCDDGAFCTRYDTCTASRCVGDSASFCDDNVRCNGVETCDEQNDRCTTGTSTCPSGQACQAGTDQ
ncbi:MAG TPA: hypothetical protein VFX59_13270, partial [Polyangiales bacterium]|nr:hypothetical protein [Polyangiales bacterium]